ncbi:hypothetical protein SAMN05444161_4739 [Rhizobiales bacterium GAS191]|nr:hypothetical protein SAMN05444161_4739 [Rhizobiales bacterium GAS191]
MLPPTINVPQMGRNSAKNGMARALRLAAHVRERHTGGRFLSISCGSRAPCHINVLLELAGRERQP